MDEGVVVVITTEEEGTGGLDVVVAGDEDISTSPPIPPVEDKDPDAVEPLVDGLTPLP